MKKIFVALLILAPHLTAQPAGELETRLAGAQGEERLALLVELAEALRIEDPARAVELGDEALALLPAHPDPRREIRVHAALGDAHLELDATADALAAYRASLKLAREVGERDFIARNLLAIGRIHLEAGRLEPAAITLRRALDATEEIDDPELLQETHLALAETYAALGRYREAFEAHRRYAELESDAVNRRADEVIGELASEFEAVRERHGRELAKLEAEAAAARREAGARRGAGPAWLVWVLAAAALAAAALAAWSFLRHRRAETGARTAADRAAELERAAAAREERAERDRRRIAELEEENAAVRKQLAEAERFGATVAHDLRIPLIAIRGLVSTLNQNALGGDLWNVQHDAERIHDAVGKMVRLLDKLLELVQIGRGVEEPEEVSLSELAFEAVGQVMGVSSRRVQIVIAPDMPAVRGDRAQLLELMLQLIDNGIKFLGDEPSPKLEVSWRKDGRETVFFVRDNGIGIDPADHERVFDLFEWLDQEKEGGFGVGLVLARRIVEAHGGRIWVESEGEGRGSTFCFTL